MLEEFLSRTQGLEHIEVKLSVGDFDVSSLKTHGAALRDLKLCKDEAFGGKSFKEVFLGWDALNRIRNSCPRLTELMVNMGSDKGNAGVRIPYIHIFQ